MPVHYMPNFLAIAPLIFLTAFPNLAVASAASNWEEPDSSTPEAAEREEPKEDTAAADPEASIAVGAIRQDRLFDELLVVGSPEEARRVPGSAHFLTPDDLSRQSYTDIHRILRQVPGINIQEEDGYGLRPNIGIRGTGVDRSQKVTLLEDGVLIAPAPYSAPAAYYTPTAGRMESFEVRKGSGAIRQGPYTNGGAINYVSTSIPGSLGGRVSLSAGEEGLRRAHAAAGNSGQRFGWLVETYQLETEGFKRLDSGGSSGFQLEDYLAKLRFTTNSGARLYQAVELKLGKTTQLGEETYLGLTQNDFDRDPYRRYASSAGDNISTDHEQIQLTYFVQASARFHLTTTLYRNDFFRNWFKLEKVGGTAVANVLAAPETFPGLVAILRGEMDSDPGSLAVRNNRRDYFSQGLQTVLAWQLGSGDRRHDLELGIRLHEDQEDRFQEDDLYRMLAGRRVFTELGAPGSNANRVADADAVAVFIEDTFSHGRWTLTPGVRVESIELMRRDFGKADPERTGSGLGQRRNDLTEIIPGFGAEYRLDDATLFFAGVHRGFSPPSPNSTEQADAEESLNFELGWRRRSAGLTAEVVGFFNDYDNLLGNDTQSTGGEGTGDQFNGGAVEVAGIEAGLARELPTGSGTRFPFRLSYTYTTAEFQSTFETDFSDWAPRVERGDELPYIPEHQLHAGLSALGDRWAVHLDASYSDKMRTHAGTAASPRNETIDARLLVDLKVELTLSDRCKLWGQLLNTTNEVYVASRRPAGLRPGRPRAALFGLALDFPG
jgi:Fe(3+) dicitrate transport protein